MRLWVGAVADSDETEAASMESVGIGVQGKVTHLRSGEASSCSEWLDLVSLLVEMSLSASLKRT